MKNSPSTSVSNSQRVRANAVWLMNAATLAVAIGAASSVDKVSIVPKAKATAYTWGAAGSDSALQTTANWSGGTPSGWSSGTAATSDTWLFGTAGTSKMTVSVKNNSNTIFGQVTFDAIGNTNSGNGWVINDPGTAGFFQLAGNSSTTSTGSTLLNNYTAGNVTFNTQVIQTTSNNTWTSSLGANTVFTKAVYISGSGSSRSLTLNGAGNFTFSGGIKNTYQSSGTQTTSVGQLTISNTGTTVITGNMDLRGQLGIATQGGTVELNGDNSTVGSSLTRSAGTDTTYAFRFTQGNVKLDNALALGTQDQVLGRTTGTLTSYELGVYTNAAITVANNFTLGAATNSNNVLNGYTLGGSSANTSTYSGTVLLNKDGIFKQVTGGTLNFSNSGTGITQGSTSRNLTFDGEGNINVSAIIGTGVVPIIGSAATSSTRVVTLSGVNTFTTGVTINSGVLALGSTTALNSTAGSENAITWGASTSNGTLRLNGNSVVVKSLTTNATAGTPIIENASASNTSATLTIGNSTNADSTFAGVIKDGSGSGTLGINKVGTGTLNLSGTNTYTGATAISAGSLNLTGSLASSSTVNVGASGTLKGTGTASGTVNVSGTINPGTAGIGTLTTGATDLKSGGTLNIQFFSGSGSAGSTGWDLLSTGVLSSSATSGSQFNINLISITNSAADTTGSASVFSNASDQNFEIIRSSSSLSSFDLTKLNFSTSGFTNGLGGGTWSLTTSGNSIYASFAKFVAGTIAYWSAGTWGDTASGTGGAGTWDNASGSWDATGGKTAVFATAGDTVAVGTVTAKKGITFSATGYVLNSGTITLADTSGLNTVTVDTGTAEIASALTGTGGFTKAGAGTLILSGSNNSLSGGMTIGLGTVKLGSATALGASSSNVSITSGAILDLNGTNYTNTNALTVAGTGVITNTSAGAGTYAGNVTLSNTASYVSTSGAINMTGTTNLNGFGLTLTTGTGDITLSNTLSGTGGLTISPAGAGSVTINGAINTTGTITVNPVTGGGNTTLSGNIGSSVNGLTYGTNNTTGTATTLLLSGTNSYTGAVNINSGTVKLGTSSAFGNSANVVTASGYATGVAIDLNGQTTANPISVYGSGIGSTGVITNTSSSGATVSGAVTFVGNATISALSGDITFSGALKTSSATNRTITFGGNVNTTTNVYVNSGVLGGASSPGYLQLIIGNVTGDKVKVSLSGTQVLQTNGNIKIQGGTLALASSSTLSSSGMSMNSGGSTGDNGSLLLTAGNDYTFSSLGIGGNLTFDTTSSATAASITFSNGGNASTSSNYGQTGSTSKQLNVKEGVTLIIGSSGSTFFDLVGQQVATANKLLKLDGAGTYTINSVLRDNAIASGTNPVTTFKGGLNKTGVGILNLNAANIYTGNTELRGGTTKLGNAAALGDSTTSTTLVYTGATLDLNGQTGVANALNLNSGTITNTSATTATYSGLISVGGNSATITAGSGNIQITNGGTIGVTSGTGYDLTLNGANNGTLSSIIGIGTGALNKSGAGTWTLNGTGATYTGTTNITAGTLTLGASNVIGSGAVTVNGGTLAIGTNSDSVGAVTLTSGSITGSSGVLTSTADFTVTSGTVSAILAGSVGLNKTGAGTVTLSGLNTYTGVTTISGGTLEINNFGGTQGNTGGIGARASSIGQATNVSSKLIVNGGTLKYTGAGETTDKKIKLGTTATIDASGSGALVFSSSPGESFVSGTTNSTLTLTGTSTANNTWRGDIMDYSTGGGATSLVKTGAGTWVLSGTTSNFTGGTTISAGTLKTGTANIVGAIENNSVLEFTNTSEGTFAGAITGSGELIKSGSGKAILSSSSSGYTGATTIKAGTLEVTNSSGLGATSGVTLGTASSSTAATLSYSGGTGEIDKSITALSTASAGNTIANAGSGLLTLSGSLTKTGTTLTLAGGSSGIKVTGEIIGTTANSDLVISTGTVTINSSNSYTGDTFINNGATLVASSASSSVHTSEATGTGVLNVGDINGGATLQVGDATHMLTLQTSGMKLYTGSTIRIYVDHVDISSAPVDGTSGWTHYDLTGTAGTAYSSIFSDGALDVKDVGAGGITIELYSANTNTEGLLRSPFYDFKFLEATSVTNLGSGLNISDLFTINTSNLRYADGTDSVTAQRGGYSYADLINVYQTTNQAGNVVLMMSIPEPSTYGLGLGALALAAVAIRRRKQKKSVA